MVFRKLLIMIATCIFAAAIFTGCGDEQEPAASKDSTKIGMLKYLNASENDFQEFMTKVSDKFSLKIATHAPVFYDSLNTMQMALESGKINEISTYQCVARYMMAHNPKVEILANHTMEFIDAFCLAMRAEDKELQTAADNAIKEMRSDGTIEKLVQQYIITNIANDAEPPAVEIAHIDGAETIKVAVTGDLPPLDLINANGQPAGFNTALLAELSKRLNKNVEILQIESGARLTALTSKKADMVFWAIVPVSEIIPANADKPDEIILTSPYYKDKAVHLAIKK